MTENNKTPKAIVALGVLCLVGTGFIAGYFVKGDPAPPRQGQTAAIQHNDNMRSSADPPQDAGGKASTSTPIASTVTATPDPADPVEPVWEKSVINEGMMGLWEGPEHKPLPEVKIARPHPDRKFKSQRPDFNIKFRIPIKGSGLYEGGCDTYVSGLAFCRVHDPSDKKTYKTGFKRKGIMEAEVKGDALRLNIPDGVVVELVRRPETAKSEPN